MDVKTSRVSDLRLELELLEAEQTLLQWRNHLYGDEIDVAQTYQGHERLFSRKNLELIAAARENAEGDEARALLYLEHAILAEFIRREVAKHDDKIRNTTASATLAVNGETFPYRQLEGHLAQEVDREKRKQIYDAALPVLKSLELPLIEKEEDIQAQALQAGFDGYVELSEHIRMAVFNTTAQRVDRFVEETDDLYESLLGEMSEILLGISPVDLRICDFPRMFRAELWDRYFEAGNLLSCAKETLKGLGIDLKSQRGLRIFADDWQNKDPRAACFALHVPTDVRISITPIGGLEDYRQVLYELGHGLHYAFTDQSIRELRRLGPQTISRAFACLFSGLIENPAWLKKFKNLDDNDFDTLQRYNAFRTVYYVRRYGALLAYQRWLHADGEDPHLRYRELLSEASGVSFDKSDCARYLIDADEFFDVVDYLRAWFLKGQMVQHLETQWGIEWFESKEAGVFLRSLWATGKRYVAEDIAGLWGKSELDPNPLIQQVKQTADL